MHPRDARRLRWQCRRGMRELDILLLGWFDGRFSGADDGEKAAFAELLALPDPELAAYILYDHPPPGPLAHVVGQIRNRTRA